jgi:hypothetical protein
MEGKTEEKEREMAETGSEKVKTRKQLMFGWITAVLIAVIAGFLIFGVPPVAAQAPIGGAGDAPPCNSD